MKLGSVNDRKLGDEIQAIQSQRVTEIVSDGESFISNHLFERKPVKQSKHVEEGALFSETKVWILVY